MNLSSSPTALDRLALHARLQRGRPTMTRTWFRPSRRWARPITDGRVGCELRDGDAEVDECAACPRLLELRLDDELPMVYCRPPAARAADRLTAF